MPFVLAMIGRILTFLLVPSILGLFVIGAKFLKGKNASREFIFPVVALTPVFFILVNWVVIPFVSQMTEYGNPQTLPNQIDRKVFVL